MIGHPWSPPPSVPKGRYIGSPGFQPGVSSLFRIESPGGTTQLISLHNLNLFRRQPVKLIHPLIDLPVKVIAFPLQLLFLGIALRRGKLLLRCEHLIDKATPMIEERFNSDYGNFDKDSPTNFLSDTTLPKSTACIRHACYDGEWIQSIKNRKSK